MAILSVGLLQNSITKDLHIIYYLAFHFRLSYLSIQIAYNIISLKSYTTAYQGVVKGYALKDQRFEITDEN